MNFEINESISRTRKKLLENFDDEVREKLKVRDEDSKAYLNRYERLLMQVTRHELREHAEFTDDSAFRLNTCPFGDAIPLGLYELPRRSGDAHFYRMTHPLAEAVLARAKGRDLPPAEIQLTYAEHSGKITLLEPHVGKSGWLRLYQVSIESLDQAEDHLIIAAIGDDGVAMDSDVAVRLLTLPGRTTGQSIGPSPEAPLESIVSARQQIIQRGISERNARIFEAEIEKLEGWADDLKLGLEREIKELDRQIKEARRAATTALTLEEKLEGQKKIKALEAQRNQRRRSLFDAQDQVDRQREDLIGNIEGKLQQKTTRQELLAVRWTLA